MYDFLKPIIDIIRATPMASFIILLLYCTRSGTVPLFMATLVVIPLVWGNVIEGIRAVDNKILDMAKLYEVDTMTKLKKIYLPYIKPYLRSAVIIGSGFAFKSCVAAEVISSTGFSIGQKIYESKVYLETERLFAWTVVIIILSIAFEKLIVKVMGR